MLAGEEARGASLRRGEAAPAAAESGAAGPGGRWDRASSERRERLLFWRAVLENAAASEVAVNVILPCFVCSRSDSGTWRAPSEAMLGGIVFALNLVGCFLEGFCKSTKLLSQTLRHTQAAHAVVFVASQGFSEGFLNVLTSFPDIAGSGGTIAVMSDSTSLGVGYCLSQVVGGILLYHWGRRTGWRSAQRHWGVVVRACRIWPLVTRGLVVIAFGLTLWLGPPAAAGEVGGSLRSSPPPSLSSRRWSGVKPPSIAERVGGALPLDLSEPDVMLSIGGTRIVYDEFVFTFPPLALGLAVGVFMSFTGAAVAAVFCSMFFAERDRPAARLITNFAATGLTLWAQQSRSSGDALDRSFVLLKFATSFCGALSAFSGTIGDVTDAYMGSASEENTLDRALRAKGWLPWVSAAQNLLAHTALTLVVMWLSMSSVLEVQPIVLQSDSGFQHWVRETEATPWHFASET